MQCERWKSVCFFSQKHLYCLVVSLAALLLCLPAFSQVNLGRITGNVTDSGGGAMANAKITITDQDRGVSRDLTTDEAGAYSAPSLLPGNYSVKVEAAGFNISERKDVEVRVGSDTRVDIVMQAGSQTQTVTVTEALPLINTTSATLGGVMENTEFTDLPVIGRNFLFLMQLTPGVISKPGGGSNANASNGMRTDANNYLFEGIFSGGVRTAGDIVNTNSSTGDGASLLPPDAIQEVGVVFQNKAEFGWRPGVATNVTVKSGTNSIHGTAFAQGMDGALNARNPFNPAPNPIPLLTYEQYGATAGGPIIKDKVFWFFGFEGMQYVSGTPTQLAVPTTALIAGSTAESVPAAYIDLAGKGKIPAAAIDANGNVVNSSLLNANQLLSYNLISTGILQNTAPNPSGGLFNYGFSGQRLPNQNYIAKVDYNLSPKNHLTGEYFISRDREIDNSGTITQLYWLLDYYLTSNVARATWTYIPNSSWVNEFHFGFDRKVENQWPSECQPGTAPAAPNYEQYLNTGVASCQLSPSPSLHAMPDIAINSFSTLGPSAGQRRVEGYFTGNEIVSYTAGNHNVKFGFEIRRTSASLATGNNGTVSFGTSNTNAFSGATSLEDFLMGFPSTGTYTAGNPIFLLRNWNYGLFVQDDWRVRQRITINFGLRWEYETPLVADNPSIPGSPASAWGLAVFDPTSVTGLTQVGTGLVSSAWKPSFFGSNFQPRFGVAWDVTGKGTTVVHAGYGIYGSWPGWSVIDGGTGNPTAANFYQENGTILPGGGSVGYANISLPTTGGTGGVPLVNWTQAGPIFPSGINCGDGLGSVNPTGTVNATTNPPNPGTCGISALDQHWQLPYIQEWNLGVQHAFTSKMSLDLSYVGTHGTNLFGEVDLNEGTPGMTTASRVQESRPYFSEFPWMGKVTETTNLGFSNYNALQATLTQRPWHGISNTVGYTLSSALDTASTDVGLSVYTNPACPVTCNYGPTYFDIRHRFTDRFTWNVPGMKAPAQLLEGWSVSTVLNLQSGIPWNAIDSADNISGTGEDTDKWDIFGKASDFDGYSKNANIPCYGVAGSKFAPQVAGGPGVCTSVASVALMPTACQNAANGLPTNPSVGQTGLAQLAAYGCYMSGNSVIVPPAQGTYGNMGKGIFTGQPFQVADFSIRKDTKIKERIGAQFRFDIFNLTNHPEYAVPGGYGNGSTNAIQTPSGFGKSASTPNVSNGNVVQGAGDARRYQFGLKLTF